MSFSMQVKDSLCKIEPEKSCCATAELYGLMLFGRKFGGTGFELQTRNAATAELACAMISRLIGITPKLRRTPRKAEGEFDYVVSVTSKRDTEKFLTFFGHSPDEVSVGLNFGNFDNECCYPAFLRGVFLSCGRLTSPEKDYHLEFSVSRPRLARALESVMHERFSSTLSTVRGSSHIIYFKDSEAIEDILTVTGAVASALELMNVKVYKDIRNRENRLNNCEASNISKTVRAAAAQVAAIKVISAHGGTRQLPPELREMARLRVHNPSASLTELGKMCEPPVSRSGVNHRISRLLELAAGYQDD